MGGPELKSGEFGFFSKMYSTMFGTVDVNKNKLAKNLLEKLQYKSDDCPGKCY
jgi:hypothetical protein